ncbi:hypothetical protein N7468_007061 [Penicillium chermesinum]|uniref:ABM domain-containing protein n=1 Tax=Penicillium chermesinum TaxID=63820 RepID=A0A9W9NU58_9EURO|nr:uncharacterized protein N7468_007061 [Penicillium chermesinum]KAJ5225836.1 hypothetical protein N7468_007061 [Penicillium chermesinum]
MTQITQFLFFKVKPSVRPEDPNSAEGEALLKALNVTKVQSSHHSSTWGRAVEDENSLVWVVDWTDARGSANTDEIHPFLDDKAQAPLVSVYTTLSPAGSGADALVTNPVTEICALNFPDSLSVAEVKELHGDLTNFRAALMDKMPAGTGPQSWAMGQVDRPSTVPHPKSPSGKAVVQLLAVGWESVEVHKKAKETEQFGSSIAPIREKMLPQLPGFEMKHVSFKKL